MLLKLANKNTVRMGKVGHGAQKVDGKGIETTLCVFGPYYSKIPISTLVKEELKLTVITPWIMLIFFYFNFKIMQH